MIQGVSAVLAAALMLSLTPSGARADGEWRQEQCRYQSVNGDPGWSHTEVAETIQCAVRHWPVDGGYDKALSVATCESGLNPLAYNSGGYAGVYQHDVGYWPMRFDSLSPQWWGLSPSVYNARSNVVIAIRYASMYDWSAWSCA
jgi:hypothetical protein